MKKNSRKSKKSLVGKVVPLRDMVVYQQGAVVSKTVIKKDVGTVTLFAFDREQGVSEHTAPFNALVYIVDGTAKIAISGKWSIVKSGEMLILPANKPHALKAAKRFKMMLVMIRA